MKSTIFLLLMLIARLGAHADTKVYQIFFANDSDVIDSTAKQTISEINELINKQKVSAIYILGYCSDPGSESLNSNLSQRRADAVGQLLDNKQHIKHQLGRGAIALNPNSSQSTEKQRTQNRMVEVTLHYQKSKEPELSQLSVGESLNLENLHFIGSRHVLLEGSETVLEDLYEQLNDNPQVHIEIQGHICCTDEPDGLDEDTGTYDLSVQRAKMVYEFLVEKGIAPERLSYKGLGSKYRTAPMNAKDRRVEIKVVEAQNSTK